MAHIIKVTIENTHPPVWRMLCVPEQITFEDLHRIVQTAFGWEDEHLHDFTFADKSVVIGSKGDGVYANPIPENMVVIDEFLKACKWIRYTYDFGDNWVHKIVFEKTDVNWDKRYPVLLKSKGDNYCENCGGIWNATGSDRLPLDIDAVNSCYASWLLNPGESCRDAEYAILRIRERARRREGIRSINKLLKQFDRTEEHKAGYQTQYERELAEVRHDQSFQGAIQCNILVPMKSMKEMIYDRSTEALRDFCQYMVLELPQGDAVSDHDKYASCIYDLVHSEPREILFAFTKDDVHDLKKLYKVPSGRSMEVKNTRAVTNAKLCGLLEFKIKAIKAKNQKTGTVATVRWASDAGIFLESLTDEVIDDYRNGIIPILDKITDMVAVYGMIRRDSFYEVFKKTYGEKIDKRVLERLINAMDYPGSVVRVIVADDGTEYVSNDTQNVARILTDMRKYDSCDIPYKIFDPQTLADSRNMIHWGDKSYRNFCEGMASLFEVTDEELAAWSEAVYLDVQEGKCPDEIYIEMLKGFEAGDVLCRVSIWEYVMDMAISTPMAALHGETRKDYAHDKKINVWTMFSHYEDATVAALSDTIFDISYEEQGKLFEIIKRAYPDTQMIKQVKDIIDSHSDKNYDLRSLLARVYLNKQDIKESERIYRQLAKESGDDSLTGIYQEIKSVACDFIGMPDCQEITTVRRDKPKVVI
jgi:hypothetical protein